ncbi:MAG TPA: HAD family hydrolase [Nocardioidaceae bacterium]|nr:HAD family hydrolase [Nocardioidaceae bacterium]
MTSMRSPAFILDLDGTLLDSVYQHVIAWQRAFAEIDVDLAVWRIHKRIGMSGSLLSQRVAHESSMELTQAQQDKVEDLHSRYYHEALSWVRPLPGARDLLLALSDADLPWIIASSGEAEQTEAQVSKLDLPETPPYLSSADATHAKPHPDILLTAAERLGAEPEQCIVVGDAIWDLLAARRARMIGVGVLCGGYSREELERAHAFRVYLDPADMLASLDELGIAL